MVCPSDMATALTALNARVEIATPKGNKLIPIEQFYVRPGKNVLKETDPRSLRDGSGCGDSRSGSGFEVHLSQTERA